MKKHFLLSWLLIACMLILSACSAENRIPDTTNWELGDFTYTNQDGNPYGLEDVKGNITMASLIFTNCTTVCSPITANMAKLQRLTEEEGLDIRFLSFSVDPEVDSPAVLKEFGERFDADFSKWDFLTGYSQKKIEEFGPENFKTIVAKPKNGGEVVHGTSIYLINEAGVIIKSYDGLDVPFDEIMEHLKILQEKN